MMAQQQQMIEQCREKFRGFLDTLTQPPAEGAAPVTVAAVHISESVRGSDVEVTFHVVCRVAE